MTPDFIPAQHGYRMPAEWEPHAATWLTWPKDPLTWPDRVPRVEQVYAQMIEALTPHESVRLLVDDAQAERRARSLLERFKIRWDRLHFHHVGTADSWIRDYGPIFLKPGPGAAGEHETIALDWIFNAWGEKYPALMADDTVPQRVLPELGIPFLEPGMVLEGGSIDVNGQGCLLTTEQCLLHPNRNSHLRREEIEEYLRQYFGVSLIVWLGEGIVGDDTDGHVDDITRFVAPQVIATAVEDDPADPNYQPLRENLRKLKKLRDPSGKAFEIVTLPMPEAVNSDEGRLPASYANFYIANGVVLVPVFGQRRDAPALETLQKLFPGRKAIGLPANDLVWGLGAIHCLTQQQPL